MESVKIKIIELSVNGNEGILKFQVVDNVHNTKKDNLLHATKPCDSLKVYMQNIILQKEKQGHHRTAETYQATLKSFLTFHKNQDIPLSDLTPELVQSYETWLKTKGLTLNTLSFYLRILRAVYNRAVNEGLIIDQHPFKQVYTGVAKTAKRGISTQDISRIMHLDLSDKPAQSFARDIFLFSFYTRGMSFIDIAKLKMSNIKNGILTYQRSKTSQRISIKWRKEMQAIVDRYHQPNSDRLLPLIKGDKNIRRQYDTALHSINHNLKKIGEQLGIPTPLTLYVARHSWASAAQQSNIPLHVISQCLGHTSERTTQIYLSGIDIDEMDKANEKIIGKVKRGG